MAGDDHEDLLGRYFPDALKAVCAGDGTWVNVTLADGAEKSHRCPVCLQQKIAESVREFTPPRFQAPIPLPERVLEWAQRGTSAQGLYLCGQVGTGKTHTSWAAIAAWCQATGTVLQPMEVGQSGAPQVIFTRMTDLLDDLRPGDDARLRVRDCQRADLLVLDDVGAEKASEWTQERLYSIIDHRYAECYPLIVTSNLPPKRLSPQTGDRVASRLAEMCGKPVDMAGDDRRRPAA